MPPKFKFTREQIVAAALEVTRKNGITGLTARGLAAGRLKPFTSIRPGQGRMDRQEELSCGKDRICCWHSQEEFCSLP